MHAAAQASITNNNLMKREYGQQLAGPDLSHISNMYHVPDSMQVAAAAEQQRNLMHYQSSVSPEIQSQQQTLRTMAPLTHM